MGYCHCLIVILFVGCVVFQDASGVASVTKSPDESLRDPGTYIVYFKKSAKKAQLNHFVTELIKTSEETENFEVEIISKFFSIKALSARLSEQAINWVRFIS